MDGPRITRLPDGRRLHMHHGPIDLIVEAFGAPDEVEAAYRQAAARRQAGANRRVGVNWGAGRRRSVRKREAAGYSRVRRR